VNFIRSGGRRAVITSIEAIDAAVEGKAGTEVTLNS
jgi:carbamate kinase